MIEIDDLEHHVEREEQQRALARAATVSAVRQTHLASAERHAKRAAQAHAEEAGDGRENPAVIAP